LKIFPELKNNSMTEISIKQNALFLPDFCSLGMVFAVVIIGELLAFILTLAPLGIEQHAE